MIIALLLIPFIKVDNFVLQTPVTVTGFLATIIIVYWPFTGFEISAIPVEETRDPRLIRRSLIMVMGIVVSVYLLLNVSLIGSVGARTLAPHQHQLPLLRRFSLIIQDPWSQCIGIVAMLSAINAYIIGTSRIIQSMSVRIFNSGISGFKHSRDSGTLRLLLPVQSAWHFCSFPTISINLQQFQ